MGIYKKLFEAKKEIGKISKDSTNPFFKSKYFDINQLLEHVEPILQKHELLLLQPILNNKQQTIIVDIESGEKEVSEIELTNITDPQKRGSEITYYRRYTAQSLLGLQAEDDDANNASKKPKQPASQTPSAQSAPPKEKPWLNKMTSDKKDFTKEWLNVISAISNGKLNSISEIKNHYRLSQEIQSDLTSNFNIKP